MAKATGHGGRDSPDYGLSSTYFGRTNLLDMGELAVRLGAPNRFDRTGSTIFVDQFIGGLNSWKGTGLQTDEEPILSGLYYYQRPYCVQLRTLASSGSSSNIQNDLPFPYATTIGYEFAYFRPFGVTRLQVFLQLNDGTTSHLAQLRIDFGTYKIYILDDSYVWIEVFSGSTPIDVYDAWNIVKLVVDYENDIYVRLVMNKNDIALTDYSLYLDSDSSRPRLRVAFYLYPTDSEIENIYLDNVIITIDEPK